MSNATALHPHQDQTRQYHAWVLGRAGLDLYPQPDGCKTRDAESFSADLGGSAGNIAIAMAKAGSNVALISGLSDDAVGDFVTRQLTDAGVDISLVTRTTGNERTSLAVAEVRIEDCEVVIYRNNPADLAFELSDEIVTGVSQASNLVITGTVLIEEQARANTIQLMQTAMQSKATVWFDLDYRAWNWPDIETTREIYGFAANHSDVIIGNEEEFAVLGDDFDTFVSRCQRNQQIVLLKRGAKGSTLFAGNARLDSGIYPVAALKPYGSGDAFLGNLVAHYGRNGDWQQAIEAGSAAAALVVSRRGCGSAMPQPSQIKQMQQETAMFPAPVWS
jgi:5-dehydro-2-deoxygluconokinase